jgi:hypothetical protein
MPITYFVVVGPQDNAIFEFGKMADSSAPSSSSVGCDSQQLERQFMVHSALDIVDELVWAKGDFYLSKVDRYEDRSTYHISAYVGFAPVKLMLMQDQEPYDNVRPFLMEAYELIVKHLLNPFSSPTAPIRSRDFDERIASIFTKYF